MKRNELFTDQALDRAITERLVRVQTSPDGRLQILNYTEMAVYGRAWSDVTRQCRGLIVDTATHEVVARPWPKFFNYGEHTDGALDLSAPVEVTDKEDGSLGILHTAGDGRPAIATRGSFTSEQAQHATALYREEYEGEWGPRVGWTYLFEVVYPANRIVCDYGGMDDLILLGAVEVATGRVIGPREANEQTHWIGHRARTFDYATLADALVAEPRPGAEGLVVRYLAGEHAGTMLKLKQDDYVILHAVLTNTSARRIWLLMAVNACKGLIEKPGEWQARLEVDPNDVKGALATGDNWLEKLVDQTPDEFHEWLRVTMAEILANVVSLIQGWQADAALAVQRAGGPGVSRGAIFAEARELSDFTPIMRLVDGNHRAAIFQAWRDAFPVHSKPFMTISEDVG